MNLFGALTVALLAGICWLLWGIRAYLVAILEQLHLTAQRHACVVCGEPCDCGGDALACKAHVTTVVKACRVKLGTA